MTFADVIPRPKRKEEKYEGEAAHHEKIARSTANFAHSEEKRRDDECQQYGGPFQHDGGGVVEGNSASGVDLAEEPSRASMLTAESDFAQARRIRRRELSG